MWECVSDCRLPGRYKIFTKTFIFNSQVRVNFLNKLSYTFCSILFRATLIFLVIESQKASFDFEHL